MDDDDDNDNDDDDNDNDNDNDNDTTDYFTPCACAWGNNLFVFTVHVWECVIIVVT